MSQEQQFIFIFWTCGSIEEARKVSRLLVQGRHVACANIIPWVESYYLWNGELETQQETKVIFKTRVEKFEEVKGLIKENCKYEIPEISKVAIDGGNQEYFDWVVESTSPCLV